MRRRHFFWSAALLSACQHSTSTPDIFPPTMASVWRRASLANPSASEAPDPVPRSAITRLQMATYQGPGKLEARAYELDSPAVALDLAQRWRPSADTVFFYRGRYFVVIKWQEADRKALEGFVRDLESRLGKLNEN